MNGMQRIESKGNTRIDTGSEDGLVLAIWGEILPVIKDIVESKVESGCLACAPEGGKKKQTSIKS